MTDRRRIAITVASALALAVTVVGRQWTEGFGLEYHLWVCGGLAACGLALVGVFLVNRWWALLPALTTVVISLLATVIHQPPEPWSSESIPLTPLVAVVFGGFAVAVLAAFLAIGLLARLIWDRFRRPRPSTTGLRETYR